MKFLRKRLSSPSTGSPLTSTAPSSFVATDLKRVVFEVAVTGRFDSTDVTLTREFGDTPRLTAVLKLHDESTEPPAVGHGRGATPAGTGMPPRGLFLGRGLTAQNVILWVLYGICMIISSIR